MGALRRKPQPSLSPLQLRIIGGRWRGRVLRYQAGPLLRPTPARVRETLFNWLQPVMQGAHCLDLFAGSGALGLEALSRGAASVCMLETDRALAVQLRSQIERLEASAQVEIIRQDAMRWLNHRAQSSFDLVFLDPPFGRGWLPTCCQLLAAQGFLTEKAHIYLESEKAKQPPALPESWDYLHNRQAGEVGYHLAQVGGNEAR